MSLPSPPCIVLAGALAHKPGNAGHAWVLLQYLLGLRDLGYRPLLIDQLHEPLQPAQRRWFERVLSFADPPLEGVLLDAQGGVAASRGVADSLGRGDCIALLEESAALINVQGYLRDRELMKAARRRIFLDIDPGFTQMWQDLGLTGFLDGHQAYATVGGRIGRDDCPIPTCGKSWIHILPPVHLPCWPAVSTPASALTSVISWRGAYGPLEYGGRTYGLRVHEFRRFWDLPSLLDGQVGFQLAIDIGTADREDRQGLCSKGWDLLPAREAAGDLESYRGYIGSSLGEFQVAKNIYVATRSGWFSDRSACYLASGRPLVMQDTGLGGVLPAGEGLLTFSTLQEAALRIRRLLDDYPAHARAARRLAEEHFDARKVLRRLLQRSGVDAC